MLDEKRLNVALTRAKCKLVIVGCAKTLRRNQLMQQLLNAIPNQIAYGKQ